MSLNWSVKDIKGWQEITIRKNEKGIEYTAPETEALIWLSMYCGYREITSKNVKDVTKRIFAWEKLFGTMMQNDKGPVSITFEIVRKHIGLKTNASLMTEKAFLISLGAELLNQAASKLLEESKLEIIK